MLLIAAEIAMLIWGLSGLFTAKLWMGSGRSVRGTPAVLLSLLLITPLPLALGVGLLWGMNKA